MELADQPGRAGAVQGLPLKWAGWGRRGGGGFVGESAYAALLEQAPYVVSAMTNLSDPPQGLRLILTSTSTGFICSQGGVTLH